MLFVGENHLLGRGLGLVQLGEVSGVVVVVDRRFVVAETSRPQGELRVEPKRSVVGRHPDGFVHPEIIKQHQRPQKQLPIERNSSNFLDRPNDEGVHDAVKALRGRVALRVVRGGGGMLDVEGGVKVLGELVTKLLTLIGINLIRDAVKVDPL